LGEGDDKIEKKWAIFYREVEGAKRREKTKLKKVRDSSTLRNRAKREGKKRVGNNGSGTFPRHAGPRGKKKNGNAAGTSLAKRETNHQFPDRVGESGIRGANGVGLLKGGGGGCQHEPRGNAKVPQNGAAPGVIKGGPKAQGATNPYRIQKKPIKTALRS